MPFIFFAPSLRLSLFKLHMCEQYDFHDYEDLYIVSEKTVWVLFSIVSKCGKIE